MICALHKMLRLPLVIALCILFNIVACQSPHLGIFHDNSNRVAIKNTECQKQMDYYLGKLVDLQNPSSWALKMLDATTKISYGYFTGNTKDMGNFDECLAIDHTDNDMHILGKHCTFGMVIGLPNILAGEPTRHINEKRLTHNNNNNNTKDLIQPEALILMLSLCLPDTCLPSDIGEYIGLNVSFIRFNDAMCQTKETGNEFDGGDIAAIVIYSSILFFAITSTSYDVYLHKANKKAPHMILLAFSIYTNGEKILKVTNNPEPNPKQVIYSSILFFAITSTLYDVYLHKANKKAPHMILLAFSIYTNGEKILKVTNNPEQLLCLNGLRFFSILYVMLGHRFAVQRDLPQVNYHNVEKFINSPESQYVQGAPIAVDTFLFLSGVLMAYGFIKTQSKPKARFNIILFYVHRYLRLTPALAAVYLMHVTLIRHLSGGPVYPLAFNETRDNCLKYWWSVFFYLQNYVNMDKICMLQTWYLSMDMQIFIVSPLVLIPLVKYSKQMAYILWVLIAASIACPMVITYVYDFQMFTQDYYDYFYYVTHTRFAPWLIGLFVGVQILKYKDKEFKISWYTNIIIWIVTLVVMFNIIYWGHDVAYKYDRVVNMFYVSTHRAVWSLGLGWIVFACIKGYGGVVNWFFSMPIFQVLAKITYSMYLVHFTIIAFQLGRVRIPLVYLEYEIMYNFFGDLVVTLGMSVVWVLMFESPMVVIEKIIFGGGGAPRPNKVEQKPEQELEPEDKLNVISVEKF